MKRASRTRSGPPTMRVVSEGEKGKAASRVANFAVIEAIVLMCMAAGLIAALIVFFGGRS